MGCGAANRPSNIQLPEGVSEPPKALEFPSFIIYFGSQTGNAKRFAKELLKDAREKYEFEATLAGLERFDTNILLHQKLALFVVSTHGEGGPTENAQLFYKWLIKDKDKLENLRFAIFGCGDSSFSGTFNKMAKATEANLIKRGAQKIFETGLGDDNKNLNGDFFNWRTKLWPSLIDFYQTEQGVDKTKRISCMKAYSKKFTISYDSELKEKLQVSDYSLNAKQYLISSII